MANVVAVDQWGNDARFVRGVKFADDKLPKVGYDLEWAKTTGAVISEKDAEERGMRVRDLEEMTGPIPVQNRVDHDLTPSAEEIMAAGGDAEKALADKTERFQKETEKDLEVAAKVNEMSREDAQAKAEKKA